MRNASELVDKELQTQGNAIVHIITEEAGDVLTCILQSMQLPTKVRKPHATRLPLGNHAYLSTN